MERNDNELYRLIGGIASDTKHILAKLGDQDVRLDRHHSRIVELEKFRWKVLGIAAAVSAGVPLILMGIKQFIEGS
jgi:hypothetical protein